MTSRNQRTLSDMARDLEGGLDRHDARLEAERQEEEAELCRTARLQARAFATFYKESLEQGFDTDEALALTLALAGAR